MARRRSQPVVRARRRRGPRLLDLPGIWFGQHLQTAIATFGRFADAPLPSSMTVAVIGISLALPAALYVMTENLRAMAGGWDQTAAISLFLNFETDDTHAERMAVGLKTWTEIARVHVITRDQALEEFRALGGFEEALEQIKENPLPVVLAIYPTQAFATPERLDILQNKLLKLPEADFARMDMLWLQRFQAILNLIQSASLLLGGLLGIGVLLIVGNTIRLEILNRRVEIEIMELVGATAAFIRRPFLYTGAWYGLLGGIMAWLLVSGAVLLLRQSVSQLAGLYRSEFELTGLGLSPTGAILASSMLLGLIGSWVAVNRHLRGAQPE